MLPHFPILQFRIKKREHVARTLIIEARGKVSCTLVFQLPTISMADNSNGLDTIFKRLGV